MKSIILFTEIFYIFLVFFFFFFDYHSPLFCCRCSIQNTALSIPVDIRIVSQTTSVEEFC